MAFPKTHLSLSSLTNVTVLKYYNILYCISETMAFFQTYLSLSSFTNVTLLGYYYTHTQYCVSEKMAFLQTQCYIAKILLHTILHIWNTNLVFNTITNQCYIAKSWDISLFTDLKHNHLVHYHMHQPNGQKLTQSLHHKCPHVQLTSSS